MAFAYERGLEKNVASLERLFGSTSRVGSSDFMEEWDVFHFEKHKPSQDLIVRICNETMSSKSSSATCTGARTSRIQKG